MTGTLSILQQLAREDDGIYSTQEKNMNAQQVGSSEMFTSIPIKDVFWSTLETPPPELALSQRSNPPSSHQEGFQSSLIESSVKLEEKPVAMPEFIIKKIETLFENSASSASSSLVSSVDTIGELRQVIENEKRLDELRDLINDSTFAPNIRPVSNVSSGNKVIPATTDSSNPSKSSKSLLSSVKKLIPWSSSKTSAKLEWDDSLWEIIPADSTKKQHALNAEEANELLYQQITPSFS